MAIPTFKINIFGTTHRNQRDIFSNTTSDFYMFLLHILKIEYSGIVLTNFDVFLKFYAFPFLNVGINNGLKFTTPSPALVNIDLGTTIRGSVPNFPPLNKLESRFTYKKPHVLHLTSTTPTSPIQLYNCGLPNPASTSFPPNNNCTQTTLISPCPNPEDFRIYSSHFYIPTVKTSNGLIFSSGNSNIESSGSLDGNYLVNGAPYQLPIEVIILANNCVYKKDIKITIYPAWIDLGGSPYGGADCAFNPQYKVLGADDIYTIN